MKALFLVLITILTSNSLILCKHHQNQENNQENQIVTFPFERKIWTYWNSDKNQIPLIVKICLDNLQSVAKRHNFTFVCLNQSNVRNYIKNYDDQFIQVRKKSIQKDFAHAADLLRMIIIEQQGGIWVDSTTIFLNGLTELQNIMSHKYTHMITNKFSSEPDALLFYYSMGQNRIQSKIINPNNNSQTILYNQLPNFQIWFIAAKKQSLFIKDAKRTYVEFTQTNFTVIQKKFRDQDIFLNRIDDFGHYLYLNMAVAYTLQRKQSQLDKQTSLFGQRKSVFEQYKLWGLHSEYGPMIMIREDLISLNSLFLYSKQEFKQMGWNFIFFMKYFGYFRYYMGWYLDNLIEAFKDYDKSFQHWLLAKPDAGYCDNLTLIVNGSIFHHMLLQSTVLNTTKGLRIFTKQQQKKWNQYCSQHLNFFMKVKKFFKNSIFHTLLLRLFVYDKIPKAKVHQILMQGQSLTLSQWIKMKYQDNSFLIFDFGYFLVVSALMFWTYQKLVTKITKMLKKYKDQSSFSYSSSQLNRIAQSNGKQSKKLQDDLNNISGTGTRRKQNLLSCLIFILFLSNLAMYNAVDITGGRQQPYTIFFFILITFLLETYIEQQTKNQQNKNNKVKYQYNFFYLFNNYIKTYLILVYAMRNRFWLNWCALVIGCMGPILLKFARLIFSKCNQNSNRFKQSIANLILSTKQIRIICIITSALITFAPNLKYLSTEQGYILQWLPIIPLTYMAILFMYVLFKTISQKLWLQLLRLVILVIVIAELLSMVDKIQFIIHINPRMLFIFRNVVILQAIYLQIGSSITVKNIHQYHFMKPFLNQALIFIGPLIIQFLFGRFYWNVEYISHLYYDYSEHLVIFCFSSFIVALFQSLEKPIQYQPIKKIYKSEFYECPSSDIN